MELTNQISVGDRYTLIELLGAGSTAKVYLAHDELLDRDIALKILRSQYAENEKFVDRFKREAQSVARLSHPNIVQVYDRGCSEEGAYYIAMECLTGGTLKERISREGPLEPNDAAAIAAQIVQALQAAHEHGIVHRDVKPQNVLMTEGGDAKVADFGIARAAAATTVSQTSLVLGTADYMSPEQAMSQPASYQSDLYSLGVVLYEMLTGQVPFEAESPVAVAMKHIMEPPRPPSEKNPYVPKGLEALTMKLLGKDPIERYGDAAELAKDLKRIRNGLSPMAVGPKKATLLSANIKEWMERTIVRRPIMAPVEAPERSRRRWRSSRFSVLAASLFGAALLGSVVWASTQGSDSAGVFSVESLTSEEAQNLLPESELTLGKAEDTPSDSASVGTNTGQDPQMGPSNDTAAEGAGIVQNPTKVEETERDRAADIAVGTNTQQAPGTQIGLTQPALPATALQATVPQDAPTHPLPPASQAASAQFGPTVDDDDGNRGRGRGRGSGSGRSGEY